MYVGPCFLQEGLTPVQIAHASGHSNLVDVLVKEYGADMDDVEKVRLIVDMCCWQSCFGLPHLVVLATVSCSLSVVGLLRGPFSYITASSGYVPLSFPLT